MHDFYSRGQVAAYIGNGKGKTSAAVGQIVRAAGHGIQSRFIQFMKSGTSGEIAALSYIPSIQTVSYGIDEFYVAGRSDILKHREYCRRGLEDAGRYSADILVLDEILDAVSCGLIREDELGLLISGRPAHLEIIMTGRTLSEEINPLCTLVSDIQNVRHYYDTGLKARCGIEY
ncbi:MAG: cob(I)yrinic acid a,c-diamide adenosyltransferase [Spirochaetota bacterium]